jgi:hypothetical protein
VILWRSQPMRWLKARDQQIRLPAEEGRNLEDVHRLAERAALARVMHVRQYRHAQAGAHLGQDREAPRHADTAGGAPGGPVRLVVAALVDQRNAEPRADAGQRLRHLSACASDSIWQWPPVSTKGSSLLTSTGPIWIATTT